MRSLLHIETKAELYTTLQGLNIAAGYPMQPAPPQNKRISGVIPAGYPHPVMVQYPKQNVHFIVVDFSFWPPSLEDPIEEGVQGFNHPRELLVCLSHTWYSSFHLSFSHTATIQRVPKNVSIPCIHSCCVKKRKLCVTNQ